MKIKFTREQIAEMKALIEADKLSKTKVSVDFMDYYVSYEKPETINAWMKACLAVPLTEKKIGGKVRKAKDIKKLRDVFFEMYFPNHTEEALAKKKAEEKKKKAEAKKENEAFQKLSPEEQFATKLRKLSEQ